MGSIEIEGRIIDINYVTLDNASAIRIAVKGEGGVHTLLDTSFHPYFYLVPSNQKLDEKAIAAIKIVDKAEQIQVNKVEKTEMLLKGTETQVFRIETLNARHVPKLSDYFREFGDVYEYDILFWKRYLIDKGLSPLNGIRATVREENGQLIVEKIESAEVKEVPFSYVCFDIETYNPYGVPRPQKDPSIMISYTNGKEKRVFSTKRIARDFVTSFNTEKEMIDAFSEAVKSSDADIISGYNSSNFDIPYLIARAEATGTKLDITRYGEDVKPEHHGLIEAVKIPGRMNIDMYNVTKFIAIVGASEKLLKINRFTLYDVYRSISGDTKITVDKKNIWQIWDGTEADREELADYSLSDSLALEKLYDFFLPLEIEIAKVTGTTLGEATISTTGQLVEYLLMRYAKENNELVMNKPNERDIKYRLANPIEGAYVKTPEAGIYDNIAVFDFRGLYPSIIIAHNIDPSTVARKGEEGYESPEGTVFRKEPEGIVPKVLQVLVAERSEIKKAYKKDPDNKTLAARSQALKILANSFYGYLGYARSRWYARECAGAVTAYGRFYISKVMEEAEKAGFKVLYGDTDSVFLLLGDTKKEEAMAFLSSVNKSLPGSMELELEDFYVRGVFVGKKGEGGAGAKKKYALLSESGRIKIKGFELVRRDWSSVARETQRKVLEAVLKEGSKEKAVAIVKEVVAALKSGTVSIKDLVIYTQLRKGIDKYDSTSPELAAAKKAVEQGLRTKEQVEGAAIGYVITKKGNTISEKAVLEEYATDYDADYYIKHQVLPATLKILKELGFSEEELIQGGSQKRL